MKILNYPSLNDTKTALVEVQKVFSKYFKVTSTDDSSILIFSSKKGEGPIFFDANLTVSYDSENGLNAKKGSFLGYVIQEPQDLAFSMFNAAAYNAAIKSSARDFLTYVGRYWDRFKGDYPQFIFQLSKKLAGTGAWVADSFTSGHWRSETSAFTMWIDDDITNEPRFGFDLSNKDTSYILSQESLNLVIGYLMKDFDEVELVINEIIDACKNDKPEIVDIAIPEGNSTKMYEKASFSLVEQKKFLVELSPQIRNSKVIAIQEPTLQIRSSRNSILKQIEHLGYHLVFEKGLLMSFSKDNIVINVEKHDDQLYFLTVE